jgi:hypothetical protein
MVSCWIMKTVDVAFSVVDNPKGITVLIAEDKDYAYLVGKCRQRSPGIALIAPLSAPPSLTAHAAYVLPWEVIAKGVGEPPFEDGILLKTQYSLPPRPVRDPSTLELLLGVNDGELEIWLPDEPKQVADHREDAEPVLKHATEQDFSFDTYIDRELNGTCPSVSKDTHWSFVDEWVATLKIEPRAHSECSDWSVKSPRSIEKDADSPKNETHDELLDEDKSTKEEFAKDRESILSENPELEIHSRLETELCQIPQHEIDFPKFEAAEFPVTREHSLVDGSRSHSYRRDQQEEQEEEEEEVEEEEEIVAPMLPGRSDLVFASFLDQQPTENPPPSDDSLESRLSQPGPNPPWLTMPKTADINSNRSSPYLAPSVASLIIPSNAPSTTPSPAPSAVLLIAPKVARSISSSSELALFSPPSISRHGAENTSPGPRSNTPSPIPFPAPVFTELGPAVVVKTESLIFTQVQPQEPDPEEPRVDFAPLVQTLRSLEPARRTHPIVAKELRENFPNIYRDTGTKKWSEYLRQAEAHGLVACNSLGMLTISE